MIMNKTILLLLIFYITCVLAQEKSVQFLQNKLTVEVEKKIIASCVDWDNYLTQSARIGGAKLRIKELKKWDGYKGGFKISEWEFFKTAGFPKYGQVAKSYHSKKKTLLIGGLTLGISGGVMTGFFGAQYQEEPDKAKVPLLIGIGLLIIGTPMAIIAESQPDRKFPVSFAIEVADDYNKRLKKYLE